MLSAECFAHETAARRGRRYFSRATQQGRLDVEIDPLNSNVIYASIYQFIRKPWTFESGGPESGLWKSTDGGDTWKELSHRPDQRACWGALGLLFPGRSPRVWALLEASTCLPL